MEKKLSFCFVSPLKKRPSGLGFLVRLWFQQCGCPCFPSETWGDLQRGAQWQPALLFLCTLFMDRMVTNTKLPWRVLLQCLWCIYKHLSAKYLINQPFKGAANLASCQHRSHHKPHFSRTAFSDRAFSWMSFKVIRPCFPKHVVNACGHLS